MTTRTEQMTWAKQRAIAVLDAGGSAEEAYSSLSSDLLKHPQTCDHAGMSLGMMLMVSGHLRSTEQMRKFIEDCN